MKKTLDTYSNLFVYQGMKNKGNIMKREVDFILENSQLDLQDGSTMFDTWTGMTFPIQDNGEPDWDMGVHITDVSQEWLDNLDNWDKRIIDAWVMRKHDFGGLDKSNLS